MASSFSVVLVYCMLLVMRCLEVCAHANNPRCHSSEHIQIQLPAAAATEKLAVEPAIASMYNYYIIWICYVAT